LCVALKQYRETKECARDLKYKQKGVGLLANILGKFKKTSIIKETRSLITAKGSICIVWNPNEKQILTLSSISKSSKNL